MNKTNRPKKTTEAESLLSHLIELRDRLIRALLGVLLVFLCLAPFANELYSILAGPLTAQLPQGSSMIAIEVAAPFLIPFKLAMMLALALSIPWVLFQAWGFIAPGLYLHERKLVLPLIASTTLLFYAGMAFAYFLVFPLIFGFFSGTAPEGVAVMTDIGRYLDFVLALFLAFGVAFEVPVAIVILVYFGITTPDDLVSKRPYVIVGAFVVGMFLTPPDVFSQTLLAVPVWMLFEAGIVFSRAVSRRKHERESQEETQYGTLSENNSDRIPTPTAGKRKS